MDITQIILLSLLGLFIALIIFMIIRTLISKPTKVIGQEFSQIIVNEDKVAKKLSEAIKIPTVTVLDDSMSYEPFLDFHSFLEKSFPIFHKFAQKKLINNYSLIYTITGSDPELLPGCFLAHQDVVPAKEEGWEVPPFSGEIKNGFIYGRGAQDMKSQMIALLEALEIMLSNNFRPKRTIYCCFGHDEEFTGKEGAKSIADYLATQNIEFEFVVDEGGTILDGSILGIKGMLALIGTCEKGYVDIQLKASSSGGHSSAPKKRNAVDLVAEAVWDIAMTPMKSKWNEPVKQLFRTVAPNMSFPFRFLFINRDVLSPLLKFALSKASPATNGLIRTTFAPTQINGSDAPNVLPSYATATINCRVGVGESIEDAVRHIKNVVGKKIDVSILPGQSQPSPVSSIDCQAFNTLTTTIQEVFPNFIPAPYPFIAATDAKYYYNLSNHIYRFTPFFATPDDYARIHAKNERVSTESLAKATQFFGRFIENTCG